MEALFLKLVNMSITASWLVLAILAVRLLFKKAPKWIHCLLWGLVAVRLILPISIESSLSLIPDAQPIDPVPVSAVEPARGEILDSEGNVILEQYPPVAKGEILDSEGNVIVEKNYGIVSEPEREERQTITYSFSWIWLLGMCAMLVYSLVSYLLLKRKVATAIPQEKGIKRSEFVDSPFVLGVFRPVIYLPFHMEAGVCDFVIAHEKAHIRRKDHWWKPLGFLLLSVYWFNPVLWIAYILLCRDIEAACDEKVIRNMDKDARRAYSTALLNCSIHRRRIAACPLAFGEVGVKTRVKGVMNYKKPAFWVILIALASCIVIAVCFLTNPKDVLPITMRAGYLNRTRADLRFVYEDNVEEGTYQIGEGYTIEALVDGNWQELPKQTGEEPRMAVYEIMSDDTDFDAWSLLNWEDTYGSLPDGEYRIKKELTLHRDSEEPETRPIYLEFTIGGTADDYVTFTLADITPTGANLYEHEKVSDEFQLIYNGDGDIWLERCQDGQWTYLEPTQYIEPILRKDKYFVHQFIHPSSHIELDWSALYGELPYGTYRIVREVTNTSEEDLRLCTAYVEFTIGEDAVPVTISLENVRPNGARILFHQNKDLIDGKLLCGREFFLQRKVNGKWEDLNKLAEVPQTEGDYDLALLSYYDADWEELYGNLPEGTYRLGKEIPMTSGEDPVYTTVYAEFFIGRVYTWFDRNSTNADERSPKDHLVELSGMEGEASLSYDNTVNTIYLLHGGNWNPILSSDVLIRSVFLTDLTGDGVSEVCAMLQNEDGMHVQVYDPKEEKLHELPTDENRSYLLTQKADRLVVTERDKKNLPDSYGELSLDPQKGLGIEELSPEVRALMSQIVCVDVQNRKHTCLSGRKQLTEMLDLLHDLEGNVEPATAQELAAAQEDLFYASYVTVNYALGRKTLVFSKDFGLVWEQGSNTGYRFSDPEPICTFVASVTDGVWDKETTGEPFATVDKPWDWAANLHSNALSTAEVYACLDVTATGNTSGVTVTNGILPLDTLQKLVGILNEIPKNAFTDSGKTANDYRSFLRQQAEGTSSVSVIDGVNKLGVAIRLHKGAVSMILTEDLENTKSSAHEYLKTPAVIWTVKDPALRTFLEDLIENPPVINYSVGAEYEWQTPLTFTVGDFSLELRLIKGWEYEYVENATDSGIRCRPEGITDGWIYFSYWPGEYEPKETNRHIQEGMHMGWKTYKSYNAGDVRLPGGGFTSVGKIWSYERYDLEQGDYVIINDGADAWFVEYQDQIQDIQTLNQFSYG